MDDVLQLIDEGKSPVMIHDRNDRRFLMFGWEDFLTVSAGFTQKKK